MHTKTILTYCFNDSATHKQCLIQSQMNTKTMNLYKNTFNLTTFIATNNINKKWTLEFQQYLNKNLEIQPRITKSNPIFIYRIYVHILYSIFQGKIRTPNEKKDQQIKKQKRKHLLYTTLCKDSSHLKFYFLGYS